PLGAQTIKICLGANAFGAPTDVFLGPGVDPWVCPAPAHGGPSMSLSRVSIDADTLGNCPAPGTIPNGDFEGGAAGWTTKQGGGVAELAPGLGENGSAALHLSTAHLCEKPSASASISLPTAALVPHPALRVWWNASQNAVASVRV